MINLIDVDGGFLNSRLDARHFVALFLKALCHNESYAMHGERISVRHIAVKESEVIDWQDHILNKPDWAQ